MDQQKERNMVSREHTHKDTIAKHDETESDKGSEASEFVTGVTSQIFYT
jgi:hypothetical protein